MKTFKRITSIALILLFVIQMISFKEASAAVYPPQPAPEKLDVKPTQSGVQPAIGYNATEGGSTGYYVDLGWDSLKPPEALPGVLKYINFYLQEIPKAYKPSKPTILKEKDVAGNATSLRMKDLSSGTIYNISARAYYTYLDGLTSTNFTSGESVSSNIIKVMTDIAVTTSSYGTNQIKIEWDDVWNSGKRIAYKLYVSENNTFTNTLPIYITQAQIGPDGPVRVNQSTGKLEYIHNVRDPGRVYYVKIIPDITEAGVKFTPETQTLAVSSYILVKTSKMSTTDTGTIWRLDWSPVVTGINSSDIKISYQIDKYVNNVPIPMLVEQGTNTFITVPPGQEESYYIIRATVTKNGIPLYPDNVRIVSDKIMVKDSEVPSMPPTPEIVDELNDSYNKPIISYADKYASDGQLIIKGELKPTSATVLWRAPRKADGSVDADTTYDIWMVNDPNQIDNPPSNAKVASSLRMGDANSVKDRGSIVGYKYVLSNLLPNTTYYFKIVAKKTYVDYVGIQIQNIEYTSEPSLKVIITPNEGAIDQPLVPGTPPLQVKKNLNGRYEVKETEVTIQLKNKWYEQFTNGKWSYIRSEKLNITDTPPYDPYNPLTLPDNLNYRKVEYDSGVTIDVGCVKFTEGMNYNDLMTIAADKVTGVTMTANDPDEDPTLNAPEQKNPTVYKKHNVNIKLTGLEPNTTYVVWVRASRAGVNQTSGPSDPIIVTTNPVDVIPVERPIVPEFNYYLSGDNFVDLAWGLKPNYNYYIKYGTKDKLESAEGSIKTSTQEIVNTGLSYYRVKDLMPNTLYYFWIQAEAVSGENGNKSDWSDSYPLKTLPDVPPETPMGFGVKNADGAVTKNSITFEWFKEEKMQYILEIAGGEDYKDVVEYKPGEAAEFKVEGLRSNARYFARLYAYDPDKKLKSEPTGNITVRTERSNDDYDSDQNIENVLAGDYVVKDPTVVNGTWNIKITGVNADRFIQQVQNDSKLDYKLDASASPSKADRVRIAISSKVFNALSELKENLIIGSNTGDIIIRPGVLSPMVVGIPADFDYEVIVSTSGIPGGSNVKNIAFKTGVVGVIINACDGANTLPVTTLERPLKMLLPFEGSEWYKEGITSAYGYDSELDTWKKLKTSKSFDVDSNKGYIMFETVKTGEMAAADTGNDYFDDIYGHQYESSIINVASVHELKSIAERNFEPDSITTNGEAVKLMLDIMDYNYDNEYMTLAARAGIIGYDDIERTSAGCTREKAVAMVARLYELKSGSKAIPEADEEEVYRDMDTVNPQLLQKVRFAIQNGIVAGISEELLAPRDYITKAELMVMIEKMMALVGEID
ncbi:MAG: fibronectin type III domain-containing protein [Clostridia bacterium]|nr:fibronectin type III domain-containing protein [Clostridia bacterium]